MTAATLVVYLPELGQYRGKELTSLVGLAPWSNEQGYRSIRGGRGTVRRVLYLAALSAIRLSRFYQGPIVPATPLSSVRTKNRP